jgi:hypothetical protein
MAISNQFKVGVIDEVKNADRTAISEHSRQVRDVIDEVSGGRAQREYYGLTTNGNPPPIEQLITADKDHIKDAIGQTAIGMYNAASDGILTMDKNFSVKEMPTVVIPAGFNKVRFAKMIAENNQQVGLDENTRYDQAYQLVNEAFEQYGDKISAARKKWSDTAKQSEKFITVASGNEGDVQVNGTDDPDAKQNMLLNEHVVGVSATDDQGVMASYASPGKYVNFSAPGTTNAKDSEGNPVEGTSFAGPRGAVLAGALMVDENLTKDQAKARMEDMVQDAVKVAGNAETGETEFVQASAEETGKGFLNINPQTG